jgi:D-alanyl-D-alanine carboxypeptidase/D-alanyl-D-alanine-endopeptidase (penicillin-binding protein 4)
LNTEHLNHQSKFARMKSSWRSLRLVIILPALFILRPAIADAQKDLPCLNRISSKDSIIVAAPDGRILSSKNETRKFVPASTLKLLTSLTAIHHLGLHYRFLTEFYMDSGQNLKIKAYGDPLLISEVWQEIAGILANRVRNVNKLILDTTYFSHPIIIPGRNRSTNPYDAPVGTLCANFNTVFFDRDKQGRIVSAEAQTPLIPYARKKILSLGLKKGRYTFSHDPKDAARYAGELLIYFLKQRGIKFNGKIRLGTVKPEDKLILAYRSRFTLEQVLKNMLEFSSNFIANQITIALGARVYCPPGTLSKGVRVVNDYAGKELALRNITVVEGSGISRKNRVSALDMLTILKRFEPYRHILMKKDNVFFKTGSLKGIRTQAGYIEGIDGTYFFVVFLTGKDLKIDSLVDCIRRDIIGQGFQPTSSANSISCNMDGCSSSHSMNISTRFGSN